MGMLRKGSSNTHTQVFREGSGSVVRGVIPSTVNQPLEGFYLTPSECEENTMRCYLRWKRLMGMAVKLLCSRLNIKPWPEGDGVLKTLYPGFY